MDDKSRAFAESNLRRNELTGRIKIVATAEDGSVLIPTKHLHDLDRIDFVMTNPPFYESKAEMLESARKKQRPAASACTGAPVEMITPGGEIQFVSRLILESLQTESRYKVQWFTSMLGKLSSVGIVIERLKAKGCSNHAVSEFVQGQKTRRWAVAWSWQHLRPSSGVARAIPGIDKKMLPFPSIFEMSNDCDSISELGARIDRCVRGLDLQWQWKAQLNTGVGASKADVWSRKARRQQKRRGDDEEMTNENVDEENIDPEPALVFKIVVVPPPEGSGMIIKVRWLEGQQVVLYESFCGWLKRKLEQFDGG